MVRPYIIYTASVFAALAFLFQGCQPKEEEKKQEESAPELDIYYDNSGPETEQSYHPSWKAGESISVFSKTVENREFLFMGSDGDKTGSFEPASGAPGAAAALDAYYAASPYSADNSISETGVISLTLPQTQSYAEGSADPAAQLLVAKSQSHNFRFLNAGCVLAIRLKGRPGTEVSTITLRGNAEEKLAGLMEITIGEDIQYAFASQNAASSITLKADKPIQLNPDSPTVFNVVVPPLTLSKGITLNILDAEGKECTVNTESGLELKRGVITRTEILDVRLMWQDAPDKLGLYPEFHHDGTPVVYTPGAMQTSVFEADGNLWARFLEMASLRIYMLGPIPAGASKGDVFEGSLTISEAGKQISAENLSFEVLDIRDGIITLLSGEDNYYIVRI